MMRGVLLLMVFIALSSSSYALGIAQIPDIDVQVGNVFSFPLMVSADVGTKTYEVYVVLPTGMISNETMKTVTLEGYEKRLIPFVINATRNGEFEVKYGMREKGSGMFQSNVEGKFKVKVTGQSTSPNQSQNTSGGTSGGGGGGSGGGAVTSGVSSATCYSQGGKYELIGGTWTCIGARNQSNTSVLPGALPAVPEQEVGAQVNDAGVGVVEEVKRELPVVEAVKESLTTAKEVAGDAKMWGIFAIVFGIVMIGLQAIIVGKLWRGET